jgi:hypothetical protein
MADVPPKGKTRALYGHWSASCRKRFLMSDAREGRPCDERGCRAIEE